MPEVTDVNRLVKDSAYAAIGFGVLGFQQAQVRRREVLEQLERQGNQLSELGDKVAAQLSAIGSQVGEQVGLFNEQFASLRSSGATNSSHSTYRTDSTYRPSSSDSTYRPAGTERAAGTGGDTLATVRSQMVDVARRIDSQVQPVRRQLDDRLSEVEELLPAPTRSVVRSIRSAASTQEQALRSAIGL